MADQRSAMKEFRLLDRKRTGEGLTAAEEARYAQLRDLVQPELAPKGGFDVDAAAARLRESLLPAGARTRTAQAAEPPARPAEEEVAPAAALAATSLEAELFGPDALAAEGDPFADPLAPDAAAAQGADPGAALDPTAGPLVGYDADAGPTEAGQPYDPAAQGYDASQAWDPHAQPGDPGAQPYDATQPWDPDAQPGDPGAQPYDATQPWDPNAQPGDPGAQPYDATQPWDPDAQPYDPAAQPYDGTQPWDPNAPPYDPTAQPYDATAPSDPDAQHYDPAAQPPDAPQPWDPDAPPYDPTAQPYAAAEPYDPGAQPYDASQPWDPGPQPHDATGAWDAGASPLDAAAALDADAPPVGEPLPEGDASEWAAAASPAGATDGSAAGEAGWDPGALADSIEPLEAGAEPWAGTGARTAEAEGWETTGAAVDAGDPLAATQELFLDGPADAPALPALDADAGVLPPAGWDAEAEPAAAAPVEAGAFGEYDESGAPQLPAEEAGADAGLASLLPFDPAAAAALAPGELPEGFVPEMGEYDDTAGFARVPPDLAPVELPDEASGFHAAQAVAAEGAPSAADVADDPFLRASGGSFDASADAAAPEWAGGAAAPPWDAGEAAGALDATARFGVPQPGAALDAPEGSADLALPEAPAHRATPEASAALAEEPFSEDAPVSSAEPVVPEDPSDPAAAPAGLAEASAAATGEQVIAVDDFAIDVDLDGAAGADGPGEAADPAAEPHDLDPGASPDLAPGLPAEERGDLSADLAAQLPEAGPVLDFSRPDFSEGGEDDAWATSAGTTARPAAPPSAAAPVLPQLELEDAPGSEEIPTLEGEEILEELPVGAGAPPQPLDFAAPEAAPAAPAAPAGPPAASPAPPTRAAAPAADAPEPPDAAPSPTALPASALAAAVPTEPEPQPTAPCQIPGAHRVVVHTLEGQVKRGVLEDPDLAAPTLALAPRQGAAAEPLQADQVKAIFFMLSPGEHPPAAEGKKVRVTFRDGRQVAGFSPDYADHGPGFFMLPADTRTSTGRIWVYRAAARAISVT